jgi:hypothetical protein
MQSQNYQNHRLMEPVQYYILLPLGLLLLAAAVGEWIQFASGEQSLWQAIVQSAISISIFALAVKSRIYALIAQDRAIRAEEQFRYYRLTGQSLPSALTIAQIVALRFASDSEVTALAQKAASEGLTAKQIKQAIVNWRGDHHRV